MTLPLFVTRAEPDDRIVVDRNDPLSNILVDKTHGDALLWANAISGTIVTSKVYPLIWTDDAPFRGIQYLQKLATGDGETLPQQLKAEQIQTIVASLRDLVYLHSQQQGSTTPKVAAEVLGVEDLEGFIQSVSNILPTNLVDSYTCHGLTVTPCPTTTHRVIRWIPFQEEDAHTTEFFAFEELFLRHPDTNLIMAFCNIDDFYFHNVENIISLDNMFQETMPASCLQASNVTYSDQTDRGEIFSFQLSPCDALEKLQQWSCFAPPMNRDQRGGQRMIFRSETLAERLFEAVHPLLCSSFVVAVNPVFRLNKFDPTDTKGFAPHLDIPYSDAIHNRRSKYSLLLYLTSGQGDESGAALQIGHHCFSSLEAWQVVVFDQRLEHEGRPYVDGSKVFLRTELLIDWPVSEQSGAVDAAVARMFNIACYHAIFHRELSAYATELFDYSAACRFQAALVLTNSNNNNKKPLYKLHFRNVGHAVYMTNGHDFWFTLDIPLRVAAILTILDYFDASYGPLAKFRGLQQTSHYRLLEDDACRMMMNDDHKIYEYLYDNMDGAAVPEDLEGQFGMECFNDLTSPCNCQLCCHACGELKCECPAVNRRDNVEDFNECAGPLRETLSQHSVAIFGGSIRINLQDMTITDSKIVFGTSGYQERVWFAACPSAYRYVRRNAVSVVTRNTHLFHMPPISYKKDQEGLGYHLTIDMFQNGWVDRELGFPVFNNQQEDGVPKTIDHDADLQSENAVRSYQLQEEEKVEEEEEDIGGGGADIIGGGDAGGDY